MCGGCLRGRRHDRASHQGDQHGKERKKIENGFGAGFHSAFLLIDLIWRNT
jgi:hypothetical protein